jgi:hypothetical protein
MFKVFDDFQLRNSRHVGGVYAFHLRLIRPARIGTQDRNTIDYAKVRERFSYLARRVAELEFSGEYSGEISKNQQYDAHGLVIRLRGHYEHIDFLAEQITNVPDNELLDFVSAINAVTPYLPPLYVGVAVKQSLQERYRQHQRDFDAGPGEDTFGGRVALAGLDWSDLLFSAIPNDHLRLNIDSTRALEKYIHYLSRPRFGKR